MYTLISKVGKRFCMIFKRNMPTAVLYYLVMMCGLVLAGCGKKPGTQMFTYVKKDDATIEITGFTDAAKEQSSFIIPTEIDGIKVTSVARESFRDCANIKEISIAEGVETTEQLDVLRKIKCDEIQGFYYARPMPEAQFIEYVRKSDNHKKL
mgnify:CR=1 FL=1